MNFSRHMLESRYLNTIIFNILQTYKRFHVVFVILFLYKTDKQQLRENIQVCIKRKLTVEEV